MAYVLTDQVGINTDFHNREGHKNHGYIKNVYNFKS